MNDILSTAAPLSTPRSDAAARSGRRGALTVGAVACLLLLVANVFWREQYTGDEGFYGVTAQNMVRSPEYLLQPSYLPAGDFATDRGGFAHPPINSYLYALGLRLARGSLAAPEVVHALAFGALLFFAHGLLRQTERRAAWFAVLLLAASPAMLASYSLLEAEPLMTTFGVAALYFALRGGFARGRQRWFFFSGLCLGLAFVTKLWLCGPLALALGVTLLLRLCRSDERWGDRLRGLSLFLAAALVPAGAHLLAVAIAHPEDLGFWLDEIYFGLFTSAGISGSKLAGGGTPAEWVHPVWYYAAALYRDHFFLAPIFAFGGAALARDVSLRRELVPILLAGAAGVIPLSLMKVKEPLYILSCTVFLYLLAACCLAALARQLGETNAAAPAPNLLLRTLDRFGGAFAAWMTVGLVGAVVVAYALRMKPDELTPTFVLAHTLTLTGTVAAMLWARRHRAARFLERSVLAGCALAIAATFLHAALNRQPRDETIARIALPHLEANAPGALSFVASNFKGYQLQMFRRGCYWHELPLHAPPRLLLDSEPFETVRVFILAPWDLRKPDLAPWLRWLERNTTEKTHELDLQLGAMSGFRLFVREAPARLAAAAPLR